MSDPTAREWRFYIDDVIVFAERVIAYTDGLDQERFVASGLNYDATVRNLELIGEAATHVPDAIRTAYPQVPWRLVIAMRNRLITAISASTTIPCGVSWFRTCRRCSSVCATSKALRCNVARDLSLFTHVPNTTRSSSRLDSREFQSPWTTPYS
jgi:uncharacterized protein with HEPN domain